MRHAIALHVLLLLGALVALEEEPQQEERNSVNVSVVTWNLAEGSPKLSDLRFLEELGEKSDLICLGVQEIENLTPRRQEGHRCREWRRLQHRVLGKDFVRLGHHSIGSIHLTVYGKRELASRTKLVKMSDVVCGVGNVLQNKGAVAAFLRVDKTTFLFITAHLAAHQTKVAERNGDYWRIIGELEQEIPPAWIKRAAKRRQKALTGTAAAGAAPERAAHGGERSVFLDMVDRVFFFGDLNYRIDLDRLDVQRGLVAAAAVAGGGGAAAGGRGGERGRRRTAIVPEACLQPLPTSSPWVKAAAAKPSLQSLLDFDQLTLERSRGGAFVGFSEARISFPPTYKYDKNSDTYDSSAKMRAPAWTDRVLFLPHQPAVQALDYRSVQTARHSDHRPVVGTYKVMLTK
ncbi:Endonuclease/exonuclease/phosphatase [Tribonema minus]|uniref:Endonuclease/exonuclease/phosphatase n=1 Tax=Tribonema minus TaxID=303371 RepID=A0A835Z9Y7_9STRA|nr:Endonuclease/exonuclease/phosphatase [Tribonema minus]